MAAAFTLGVRAARSLFALVLVVLHFGTIEQFARLARAARPGWFFPVCVAQAATYVCASLVWRQALRRAGHPRPLSTLIVSLAETVMLEFAVFALDALTLWLVFRALGDTPAIWIAFVSFLMASMAATLGPIPLGLGTFEAARVGMLSLLGVAIETALAATLLPRGLTLVTHGARSVACQTRDRSGMITWTLISGSGIRRARANRTLVE